MAWDWLKDNNDGKEYHDYWTTKLHNGLANVPKSLLGAVESIPAMAARTRPVVMQELENDLDGTGLMDSDADKEALSDVENQIKGTTAPIWEGARLGVKAAKDALPDANWESNVDESQLSYPKKIGGMILENAPLMAAQLGASIINPVLGVALVAGSIAGDAYNDLTEKGVDPLAAGQAGWLDAAAQAPLEGVGEMGWLKAFRELGTEGAAKLMGKAFVKEGLTEAVQEFPDETIPYIAEHGSLDGFDWGQLASNAVDAGVVGGIYGGGFAGIGRAINGKAQAPQQETGQDSADVDNGNGDTPSPSPAMHAMNHLVNELGIDPKAASGIVGGLMLESGGNTTDISPTAENPTSGSYGIGQWLGPRKDELMAFAEETGGDPNDLDTQISFLIHELKGSENGALQEILKAQSPDEAGRLADQFYERSEGTDEIRNQKAANAQKIYDIFMNGGADPNVVYNGGKMGGSSVPNPKSAEDFLKDLEETLPADTDEDVEKLNAVRKAIQGKNKKAQEELAAQYGWSANSPETAQGASEPVTQGNTQSVADNAATGQMTQSVTYPMAIPQGSGNSVSGTKSIKSGGGMYQPSGRVEGGNKSLYTPKKPKGMQYTPQGNVQAGSNEGGMTAVRPNASPVIPAPSSIKEPASNASTSLPSTEPQIYTPRKVNGIADRQRRDRQTRGNTVSAAAQDRINKALKNSRLRQVVKQAFVDGDKDALNRLGAMQINQDVLQAVKNDVLNEYHKTEPVVPPKVIPAQEPYTPRYSNRDEAMRLPRERDAENAREDVAIGGGNGVIAPRVAKTPSEAMRLTNAAREQRADNANKDYDIGKAPSRRAQKKAAIAQKKQEKRDAENTNVRKYEPKPYTSRYDNREDLNRGMRDVYGNKSGDRAHKGQTSGVSSTGKNERAESQNRVDSRDDMSGYVRPGAPSIVATPKDRKSIESDMRNRQQNRNKYESDNSKNGFEKPSIPTKENNHENTEKNQQVHRSEENKNDNAKPEQSKPSESKDRKTPEGKNPVKNASSKETPSSDKKEEPQKTNQKQDDKVVVRNNAADNDARDAAKSSKEIGAIDPKASNKAKVILKLINKCLIHHRAGNSTSAETIARIRFTLRGKNFAKLPEAVKAKLNEYAERKIKEMQAFDKEHPWAEKNATENEDAAFDEAKGAIDRIAKMLDNGVMTLDEAIERANKVAGELEDAGFSDTGSPVSHAADRVRDYFNKKIASDPVEAPKTEQPKGDKDSEPHNGKGSEQQPTLADGYTTESGRLLSESDARDFIVKPDGSKEFGHFGKEIEDATGGKVLAKGIRLQVGFSRVANGKETGFGIIHIKKRESQLKKLGYNNAEEYILDIINNFSIIYDLGGGRIKLASVGSKFNVMPLDLELKGDGNGYYTVVTAIPKNTKRMQKEAGKKIFDRSASPSSTTGNGAVQDGGNRKNAGSIPQSATEKSNLPASTNNIDETLKNVNNRPDLDLTTGKSIEASKGEEPSTPKEKVFGSVEDADKDLEKAFGLKPVANTEQTEKKAAQEATGAKPSKDEIHKKHRLVDDSDEAIQGYIEEFISKTRNLNAGFDPTILVPVFKICAAYTQRGIIKFADFASKTIAAFKAKGVKQKDIEPWLAPAWEAVKSFPDTGKKFDAKKLVVALKAVGARYESGLETADAVKDDIRSKYGDKAVSTLNDYIDAAFRGVQAYFNKGKVAEPAKKSEPSNVADKSGTDLIDYAFNQGGIIRKDVIQNMSPEDVDTVSKIFDGGDKSVDSPQENDTIEEDNSNVVSTKEDKDVRGRESGSSRPVEVGGSGKSSTGGKGEQRTTRGNSETPDRDGGRERGPDAKSAEPKNKGTGESRELGRGQAEDGTRMERTNGEGTSAGGTKKLVISPKADKVETDIAKGKVKDARDVPGNDYIAKPVPPEAKGASKTQRVDNNIAAIKLLKKIESENRMATPAEQEILAGYSGWGGLGSEMKSDAKRMAQLKELLTEEEYNAAERELLTAFYTPPFVISRMWELAEHLGFKGGRVLDPSCGVGSFFSLMPASLRERSTALQGVELSPIPARIAKQLYQSKKFKIDNQDYTKFDRGNGFYDLAITNVPFSNSVKASVPAMRDSDGGVHKSLLIHDYYFAQTLDKVRPGGLIVFMTSSGTMDRKAGYDNALLRHLSSRAKLVGIVRLPNTLFAPSANVGTDIVVFRKLNEGENPDAVDATNGWTNGLTTIEAKDAEGRHTYARINGYYEDNPDNIIGDPVLVRDRYGSKNVEFHTSSNAETDKKLGEAIARLPENVYVPREPVKINTPSHVKELADAEDGQNVGDIIKGKDGQWGQVVIDDNGERKLKPFAKSAQAKVGALKELSDSLNDVLAKQVDPDVSEAALSKAREKLNKQYDSFVRKYGYINDKTNVRQISGSPIAGRLLALEQKYKAGTKGKESTAEKAPILTERTAYPATDDLNISTTSDALASSLRKFGFADIKYMASVLGKSEEYGYTREEVETMQNPVLIRQRDASSDSLQDSIIHSTEGGMKMSASQQAKVDAEKISPKTLNLYDYDGTGDLTKRSNDDFVVSALNEITDKSDRDVVFNKDGTPSKAGIERVKSALAAYAYGDNALLEKISESTGTEDQNIVKAFSAAAPRVAAIKAKLNKGGASKDYDLSSLLSDVLDFYFKCKTSGKSIKFALNETSLFGDDSWLASVGGKNLARFIADNTRRPKAISDAIVRMTKYIDGANEPSDALFSGTKMGIDEIVRTSIGLNASKFIPVSKPSAQKYKHTIQPKENTWDSMPATQQKACIKLMDANGGHYDSKTKSFGFTDEKARDAALNVLEAYLSADSKASAKIAIVPEMNEEVKLTNVGWNGSPGDFSKFDLAFVGSGEGSAAHGWGIYFAMDKPYRDNPDFGREVAERYKKQYGGENGHVYKAAIPSDEYLLDERAKISDQPKRVQNAVLEVAEALQKKTSVWRFEDGIKKVVQYLKDENYDLGNENGDAEQAKIDQALERVARDFYANSNSASPQELKISSADLKILRAALKEQVRDQAETSAFSSKNLSERDMDQAAKEILYNFLSASRRNQFRTLDALAANIRAEDDSVFKNITSQDLLNKAGEIAGTALREKQIDLGGAREILNVMKQAAEHPTDANERDVAEGIIKAYTDYGIDRATAEKIARRQAAQFFSALRESRAKPIKEILAPLTGYDVQQMFQTAIAKQQLEPSEPVDKAVSMLLKGAGLKGYKYEGATDGHCVVVFDNDAMKIINKFSVKTPYQKMVENITPIASDDLTAREHAIVDFAKKMGLQVQFFEGDPNLHGFHADGTNVAFLNRRSAMDLNQTFWHEAFHWMRESNPDLYNQMVKEVFGGEVSKKQLADYAVSIGRTDMSKELAIEEMLADAMWDAGKRGSFFEKLGIEHPSLCAKIIKWIKNLYEDFKAHFHNPQAGLTNTQIKRMSNTLSKIAEKLVDGDGNKLFSVDEKGNIKETAAGKRAVSDRAKVEAERDGSNQKYRVTNKALSGNDQMQVTELTGDIKDERLGERVARVCKMLEGCSFAVSKDGIQLYFKSNKDLDHFAAGNKGKRNKEARLYTISSEENVKNVIENSVYVEEERNIHNPNSKTHFVQFYSVVKSGNNFIRMKISAKKLVDGTFDVQKASLYNIATAGSILHKKIKKLTQPAMNESMDNLRPRVSSLTVSVADMLDGVNDRVGNPYVVNGKLQHENGVIATKNMLSSGPVTHRSAEDLKAQTLSVFPNAQNIETHDNGVSFDLPNGSHVEVNFTDDTISVDRAKAQKDYGGTLKGNEKASGKIEMVDKDALITLTMDSPDETVSHEAMHLAWNLLTDRERNALLRTYGSEEGAAEGMREWKIRRKMKQGTIAGKIMQKISDMAHKLLSLFHENDQHVFQKLESGEMWERSNENNTAARNVKYKMNPLNEAEKYLKSHKDLGEKAGVYIDRTFRPDLAKAKANPNISVNKTAKKKGWGVANTALNNTVRSPSRIKSPKTNYIWGLADTAQRELQELRGRWTHNFAGAIKNLNKEEKARYTDILWEEDMKQHVFSDEELREAGVSENVIKAHQKTRNLLGKIYNAVNAVYTSERVENFTYKTRKGAEKAQKELAKRPHTFVMHDIRETTKDGEPVFQVSIKTRGYKEIHSVMTSEELSALSKDKDVYIKAREQMDDGSFKVSYLAYNKPLTNMEGYMPHIFHGVLIMKKYTDADGNVKSKVVGSADTIEKAVVKADAMQKEDGGEFIIAPKEFSSEGEVENPLLLGDMDYFKLMENLSKGASITLDEAREMTHATMKGRHVYYGAKKHRKGAEGFEKNAIWAIQHHIDSSSRYVALDPFKQKAISFFERAFGDYNKDWTGEAAFCKGYIDSVLGKPSRLETLANDFLRLFPWFKNEARPARRMAGNLTGLTGVLKLGASLSSGFVNTLQLFNCVGYVGARKTAVGLKRALHPNATDKKILVASGVSEESGLALDSIGHITAEGTALSKAGNVINSVNNFLMKPFTLAEKTIRKATILAAYYKAIEDGLSKGEAIQYARDINRKVNFDYSVADAPRIFRALQGTVIGDMALQFQKYGVKEMEVISDFLPVLGNTTTKQKLEFFIPYLLVSGIWNAFPFEDALLSLLKLLGFDDPEKEAKRAMMEWAGNNADRKALVNVANYGAGAIVGVDISQRVGLKGVVPETSNIVTGGPLGSTTVQLAKAVLNGDANGAMKAISPALGNVYGAVAGYNTDSKGRKTVDYDTRDRIVRGLGFRTIKEANATDAQSIVYNYKEQKKNDRAKAKSEYLKDPSSSNRQKLKEMGYSDKEIKALKDDKKSTRVERSQVGLSKEDKKKLKPVFDYVQ